MKPITLFFDIDATLGERHGVKFALYPQTVTTLEKLSKDFKLGIFSQGFWPLQYRKLASTDVVRFFDHELIKIRPFKVFFVKELRGLEAVLIDNNERIVSAAQKAGVATIHGSLNPLTYEKTLNLITKL